MNNIYERICLKTATATISASGQVELVAAVTGHCIKVVDLVIQNNGNAVCGVKLQSGDTDITKVVLIPGTNGSWTDRVSAPAFIYETAVGEALNATTDDNKQIDFTIVYYEFPVTGLCGRL